MKLMHLSDLHIGKRVNEFPMLTDQREILSQILEYARIERPDGVLIAGDVYDKPVPSADAMMVLDDFLVRLSEMEIPVFLISGNHDSAERVAFGGRLMERSQVYVSPCYSGHVAPIPLEKDGLKVNLYLLPFVKPSEVRRFFTEEEIQNYTQAMAACIREMQVDTSQVNILVTHQFVSGGAICDSEEAYVGGTENVSADVFSDFDYVALGHLHGPQSIRPSIRYAGSPLKYSFSERLQTKSVTMVTIEGKGQLTTSTLPLTPPHDLREIRGTYEEVTYRENYIKGNTEDYVHIILTDEEDVPDAMAKLRIIYPNLMKLDYDNTRTRTNSVIEAEEGQEGKSEMDLLQDLYRMQNGMPMSAEMEAYARSIFDAMKEDRA